jgi:hypothetical protein
MKLSDIKIKSGNVEHWALDAVNAEKPLAEQLRELKEDLAQISFPRGLVVDVGWYPEFARTGSFQVSLIQSGDWDHSLRQFHAFTVSELIRHVNQAIHFAESRVESLSQDNRKVLDLAL